MIEKNNKLAQNLLLDELNYFNKTFDLRTSVIKDLLAEIILNESSELTYKNLKFKMIDSCATYIFKKDINEKDLSYKVPFVKFCHEHFWKSYQHKFKEKFGKDAKERFSDICNDTYYEIVEEQNLYYYSLTIHDISIINIKYANNDLYEIFRSIEGKNFILKENFLKAFSSFEKQNDFINDILKFAYKTKITTTFTGYIYTIIRNKIDNNFKKKL